MAQLIGLHVVSRRRSFITPPMAPQGNARSHVRDRAFPRLGTGPVQRAYKVSAKMGVQFSSAPHTETPRRTTAMEIQTTDGTFVGRGSRVLCYYATPVQYGTITEIDGAGWADVEHDDGTRGYYDGDRLAFKAPASGPAAIGPDPRTPGYAGTPTLGALVDGTFGR